MQPATIATLGAVLTAGAATANAQTTDRPNFVIIFIDDLGYNDLGFRNPSFHTPHIDSLAQRSINFAHAYVPSPTSSPSRAALLTGRHPIKTGLVRHINEGNPDPFGTGEYESLPSDPGRIPNRRFLPNCEQTFASVLKAYGYRTAAVGKWHLGTRAYYPDHHGFELMRGESDLGNPASYFPDYFTAASRKNRSGKYLTDYLTDCAVEIIEQNDYAQTPLCLYVAHYGVHTPHMAPEELVKKYTDRGLDRRYAIYHAMVESVDTSTGRILEALERAGVADNTLLFFISDQGGFFSNAPLRGGKMTGALYEGGARVPFFVLAPGAAGRVVEERISTLDVFPTLLEYAGLQPSDYPQLEGQSLQKTIRGGRYSEKPLYFYRSYEDQPAALIDRDFKFIWSRRGNHELYDLDADPNETANLAHDPKFRRIFNRAQKMMSDFLDKYEPNSLPE